MTVFAHLCLFLFQFLTPTFSHWTKTHLNFQRVSRRKRLHISRLHRAVWVFDIFPLLVTGLIFLQATWGNVSHCGVFTDKGNIPKGTRFGPFQGKLVNTSEIKTYDDNTLMWEVCARALHVSHAWIPSDRFHSHLTPTRALYPRRCLRTAG